MSPGAGPSAAQPTMDLSDFGLDSITATPSSSSVNPPTPTSYFYPQTTNYFVSGDPVPSYNPSPAYRGLQWPSTSQIPLSNYSSLNGATSVPQSAPSQVHPSMSPPQMMIDAFLSPQLTVTSPPPSQPSHYSVPYISAQPQQRAHYSYQHPSHTTPSSISPSYVHTTPAHFQQPQFQRQLSQQQSPPPPQQVLQQGTLSPYALHSPPPSALPPSTSISPAPAGPPAIPATTFYGHPQPPAPSGPSPEHLKEKFVAGVRPLIQPQSFTGAGAVNKLTSLIDDYGISKVDAFTRIEILNNIRDNAANHYFRAWQESEVAMDITKTWLKESAEPDSPFTTTTMPILHILDRLPMTFQCLKTSLIARDLRPFKTSNSAAIQDMAANLTRKWRALLPQSQTKTPAAEGSAEDPKNKKRKADEMASSSKAIPTKKLAVAASTKPAPNVKKEAKPTGKEPTTAKSDSSFFSKPKPRLPSFNKKTPVAVKKEPDPNVAQPSSYNPFMEIVASMKPRKDSPSTSTPPPAATPTGAPTVTSRQTSADGINTDKKKKSVTWAPDGQLEAVKLIERAIYDDDPADVSSLPFVSLTYCILTLDTHTCVHVDTQGMHTAHSVRDLDRSEGAALIAHLFDEQVDWSEPLLIDVPTDIGVPSRGRDSIERVKQEEREQTALGALYLTPADLPDSPAEPDFQIPEEQVDAEIKSMLAGPDADEVFWTGDAPAALAVEPPPAVSVAELVGQLSAAGGSVDVPMGNTQLLTSLAQLGPDIQQLVQQAQASQPPPPPPAPPMQAAQAQNPYPAGQPAAPMPRNGEQQDWNANPYPDFYAQGRQARFMTIE
ncbi:hypothetical protein EIP86_010342 [Pleurotus ostreatoroseus]|nr:hypothetical protein EIP86_010342 [Pleurotus ostreatoroseus]